MDSGYCPAKRRAPSSSSSAAVTTTTKRPVDHLRATAQLTWGLLELEGRATSDEKNGAYEAIYIIKIRSICTLLESSSTATDGASGGHGTGRRNMRVTDEDTNNTETTTTGGIRRRSFWKMSQSNRRRRLCGRSKLRYYRKPHCIVLFCVWGGKVTTQSTFCTALTAYNPEDGRTKTLKREGETAELIEELKKK